MKKGYIVIEDCENYEQVLCLDTSKDMPEGGVLCWPGEGFERHVFASRKEARSAVNRTDHYIKAFNESDMPEKKYCKIHRILLPGFNE